jgi:hypothetical protein
MDSLRLFQWKLYLPISAVSIYLFQRSLYTTMEQRVMIKEDVELELPEGPARG